jgi:hypothetical protein
MSHCNALRIFKPYLFKIRFNIVLSPKPCSLIKVLWQEFVQCGCLIVLMCCAFHGHLSVPGKVILVAFGEEKTVINDLHCEIFVILHSPPCRMSQFSHSTMPSSLRVEILAPCPYKTAGKFAVLCVQIVYVLRQQTRRQNQKIIFSGISRITIIRPLLGILTLVCVKLQHQSHFSLCLTLWRLNTF